MDRFILLALLGIPLLVILHVALFWDDIPTGAAMDWTATADDTGLQGHWRSQDRPLPSQFVIRSTSKQGS
jgi:hypothetical protein